VGALVPSLAIRSAISRLRAKEDEKAVHKRRRAPQRGEHRAKEDEKEDAPPDLPHVRAQVLEVLGRLGVLVTDDATDGQLQHAACTRWI
jgi:hypothetical protein